MAYLQKATDGLIALPSPAPKDPGKDNTADGNFECLPHLR
jgi:hypothetical protein